MKDILDDINTAMGFYGSLKLIADNSVRVADHVSRHFIMQCGTQDEVWTEGRWLQLRFNFGHHPDTIVYIDEDSGLETTQGIATVGYNLQEKLWKLTVTPALTSFIVRDGKDYSIAKFEHRWLEEIFEFLAEKQPFFGEPQSEGSST